MTLNINVITILSIAFLVPKPFYKAKLFHYGSYSSYEPSFVFFMYLCCLRGKY